MPLALLHFPGLLALRAAAPCRARAPWPTVRLWVSLLCLAAGPAFSLDLPRPERLEAQTGIRAQPVIVVEPHESTDKRRVTVEYRGFPVTALLDHWFGTAWKTADAEVVFHAADGYRSVMSAIRLQQHRTYLAVGRADGRTFSVDNAAQHQRNIPLGPYYLIWDNRSSPELLSLGTYGWPYQITRIELRSNTDDQALMPANASDEIKAGFDLSKGYCLTCHRIRGVGGGKHPVPLEQAVCAWADESLKAFIDDPTSLRPGTTMPALQVPGGSEVRQRTIGRILAYLRAIASADSTCR